MPSQTSRDSATPSTPYSRRAGERRRRPPARMRSAGSSMAVVGADDAMVCVLTSRAPFQGLADLSLEVDELEGVGQLQVPWAGQVDVEDGPGPAKGARHDADPVAQQDRLLDVVGDEDDRHPVAFPQVQQEPL